MKLFVIKNGGPPLLGRDFFCIFDLGLSQLNYCERFGLLGQLNPRFEKWFESGIGTFNKVT